MLYSPALQVTCDLHNSSVCRQAAGHRELAVERTTFSTPPAETGPLFLLIPTPRTTAGVGISPALASAQLETAAYKRTSVFDQKEALKHAC